MVTPSFSQTRHGLRQTLAHQVLPRFGYGRANLIPACLPLVPSLKNPVSPLKIAPDSVPEKLTSTLFAARWREMRMHAIHFPYFSFVLEGEVDFRLALQTQDALIGQILTLRAGDVLAIPPLTLYPDASCPHWERPHSESACSKTFWVHVMPNGAYCHLGTTRGGQHFPDPEIYIRETGLWSLAQEIERELASPRATESVEAALLLHVLLARLLRALESGLGARRTLELHSEALSALPRITSPGHSVFERLCALIDENIDQVLTPASLATSLKVSATRLNLIARAESGQSTMELVQRRRLALARHLLASQNDPIQTVARQVGFLHAAHFTRAFYRAYGQTPRNFRESQNQSKFYQSKSVL